MRVCSDDNVLAGPRLIVMHLDGCLYLIHADMLQQRSAALTHPSEATTFFVAVDVQEKTTLARAAPYMAQVSHSAGGMQGVLWTILSLPHQVL